MQATHFINVALGRANLTRKITVAGERTAQERFVSSTPAACGWLLRSRTAARRSTRRRSGYDIFPSDDRDQYGQRVRVMGGSAARYREVRLNAGIYSIVVHLRGRQRGGPHGRDGADKACSLDREAKPNHAAA